MIRRCKPSYRDGRTSIRTDKRKKEGRVIWRDLFSAMLLGGGAESYETGVIIGKS